MNNPCQHVSICECDVNPLSNYSSEAPDVDFFRLPAWAFRPRRLGDEPDDGWDVGAPPTTCDSTVSPEASLLCGLTIGTVTPPGINPPPPPNGPGGPTGPGGDPIVYYYNRAKVCSVPCADGTFFSYTVAAGTFVDLSQDMADQRAFSYACFLAFQRRACLSSPTSRACLDTVYSDTITVSRGGAWTFAIIAGTLPPGLTFSSGPGVNQASITGTPTTAGSYSFDVQATSVIGITATKTVTIDVMGITTASPLPNGTVGAAYSETLTAVGGTAPYTFSLEIGLLPAGLTLASDGTISGTPTADGTETITVGVSDSAANFCIKDFLLTINPGACPQLINTILQAGNGIGYLTTAIGTGELAHPNKAYIWDQIANRSLAFDIDTDTFITSFGTPGGFQPDSGGAWAAATDRLFYGLIDTGGPVFYVGIINTANNTNVGAVNASQYQFLFWQYDLALNLVFVQTYIFDGVATNGWIHHLNGLTGAISASTQVVGHGGIVLGMCYAAPADQIIVSIDTDGLGSFEIAKFDRLTGAPAGNVATGTYEPDEMVYVPTTDKIYVISKLQIPGNHYHLLIYDRATLTLQKDITLESPDIYEGITYSLGAGILIACSDTHVSFVDVSTETLMCSRAIALARKADVFGSKFYVNPAFTDDIDIYQ